MAKTDTVVEREDSTASMAAILDRLTSAVELLAKRPESTNPDTANLLIKEAITELAKQNQRHVMPSNARNEDARSVFRPKGEHHPDYENLAWHRQPWFNGNRVGLMDCTPEEIAAYNELSALLPSPTSTRRARDGKWRAWIGPNNADLYLSVPCKTIEDQANLPATLVFVLREFIDGKTVDPANLYAELAALQAQMKALQDQQKAVSA